MDPQINPSNVRLTVWQITQFIGMTVGEKRSAAPDKAKAIARLLSALKQRVGDGALELHRSIVLAGSCSKSLELLKSALIKIDKQKGIPTTRLEATTINGMGTEMILSTHIKESTMNAEVAEAEGTTGETVAQVVKKKRTAEHAGHLIKHACKKDETTGELINPRKAGTHGFRSMAIIMEAGDAGIMYEDFIKAGGRPNDLKWDVDHKHVTAEIV